MIIPARRDEIRALLAQKRGLHPELRWPLTMQGLRRMLARESVALVIEPYPRLGFLMPLLGSWTLIIDEGQPFDTRAMIGAHELAHLWLHHDPFFDRTETAVYDRSPDWYDDVREAEADYAAERMLAGPEEYELAVRDNTRADVPAPRKKSERSTRQRKPASNRHAASNVPLGTRKAPPRLPLPDWLEDVERDADAVRLVEHARNAQRAYAREYPALTGPTIQFAIDEAAWQAVHFSPGDAPHYRRTTAVPSGTTFVIVTCTPDVASRVVASLARAGHKRTAVFVRRRVREALRER
jgi:hypothetical protein